MSYALLFIAMFTFVALKAFQQRNVAFNHYAAVPLTSLMMAATEVYVIARIATSGYNVWTVLTIGGAGGLGAVCAMWLHNRVFK